MRRLRQSFWLWLLDMVFFFGGYGTRLYYWALEKAGDATEYDEASAGDGEEPF